MRRAKGSKSPGGRRQAHTSARVPTRIWTQGNRLLAALSPPELADLAPRLRAIDLKSGDVLYQRNSVVEHVYFPDTAVISVLNQMASGAIIEVGTIGNEGMVGLNAFLGA